MWSESICNCNNAIFVRDCPHPGHRVFEILPFACTERVLRSRIKRLWESFYNGAIPLISTLLLSSGLCVIYKRDFLILWLWMHYLCTLFLFYTQLLLLYAAYMSQWTNVIAGKLILFHPLWKKTFLYQSIWCLDELQINQSNQRIKVTS